MKARIIFEGFGVGILVTMPYIWPLFSPYHSDLFHSRGSFNTIVWACLLDLCVASLLAILILGWLEKRGAPYRSLFWALVVARLGSVLVQAYSVVCGQPNPGYLSTKVFFIVILAAACGLRWLRPATYERFSRVSGVVFSLLGFCIIWIVPELVYQGSKTSHSDLPIMSHRELRPSATVDSEPQKRVVWLIFDELSFYQTFSNRFPGLEMPNFDALKGQTAFFTNVIPAGYHTEHVIPGFLLGRVVDDSRSDTNGQLFVKFQGEHGWREFEPGASIFADAQREGWSTGLVGWYNPYCRMLPGLLDFCYWDAEDEMQNGMSPQNSILANALAPITSKLSFLHRGHVSGLPQKEHERNLTEIMKQAQKLIHDEGIRFVFIHLPIPHPPGIYDRATGQMRDSGTYIDNLALADHSLSTLMDTLKATRSWADTTLIVCSDHAWRVPLWKSVAGWTNEEETASRGEFHPRPVLMVRFPNQSKEVDISRPFSDIKLHALVENLLNGQVNSSDTLESWTDDGGGAAVPATTSASVAAPN